MISLILVPIGAFLFGFSWMCHFQARGNENTEAFFMNLGQMGFWLWFIGIVIIFYGG